ncbi:MAG TPA: protein kinase [Pyrinomonadaceae bacterium]|nr:protein kinase [Pyrinomonadaceae bacterium]
MAEIASDNPNLSPGTQLGRFELRKQIGKGGMGEVYQARDQELGRLVALKFLPADLSADRQRMQRFINEAKIVSSLNHPNILTIFEVGEAAGIRFIATEYVDGVTLRHRIIEGPGDLQTICSIGLQVANALEAAHSAGIVHRDIKPENIMLRKDGIVKVLDFGLAKLSPDEPAQLLEAETLAVTEPGLVLGTISYMSPEQARGLKIDKRSDIFSLGVVVYEMISGRVPFAGSTVSDMLVSILDKEPAPLLQVPPEVEAVVLRALAKDCKDRYQTAGEFSSNLAQLQRQIEFDTEASKTSTFMSSLSSPAQSPSSRAAAETRLSPATPSTPELTQTRSLPSKERSAAEIAHILFIDIVGYSQKATHSRQQLVDYLNAIVRRTEDFRRAQGDHRLISRATGDGMALIFFRDPEAPARCAIQIAKALKNQNEIALRMGIHSGIVYRTLNIANEQDVTGRGVNIAERIMSCGDPGHILLSREMVNVLEEIGDWENHVFDLGVTTLKHGMKVQLFNLCVGGVGNPVLPSKIVEERRENERRASKDHLVAGGSHPSLRFSVDKEKKHISVAAGAIKSLAILPLTNASADQSMEYLSDGITESIINSLSQLPEVRVMARATVFRYKNKDADPMDVGSELGVSAVVNGKVLHLGEKLIIGIELVNTADGTQIWGEQYRRQMSDIFELQEEISKTISERLKIQLSNEEEQRLTRRYTDNIEAYQSYLKGRYFWSKRTRDGLRKGAEYFRQAIDIDPTYALAYAGLADAYAFLGLHRVIPPHDVLPKARGAAIKALEIDETLAEGYSALAYIKTIYDWDWAGAEKDFSRALELNQRDPLTRSYHSNYLSAMGRHDEAMAEVFVAQQLDPLSPIINLMVGYISFLKRDYELSMKYCRQTQESDPNFFWIYMGYGWSYEETGRVERAIPEFQKAVELTGGTMGTLAGLGHAYALAGQTEKALEVIQRLQDESQQSYVVPYDIALVYAGLGDKDQAMAHLEKAYEARFGWLIWINVEPKWDFLRDDPRFQDLIQRMGFPTSISTAQN